MVQKNRSKNAKPLLPMTHCQYHRQQPLHLRHLDICNLHSLFVCAGSEQHCCRRCDKLMFLVGGFDDFNFVTMLSFSSSCASSSSSSPANIRFLRCCKHPYRSSSFFVSTLRQVWTLFWTFKEKKARSSEKVKRCGLPS
jgi:hypothetical protein